MNDRLISVIMPTYNRGYIIKEAITSVIKQTYCNWELIIVDDASDDNTREIVEAIKEARIVYIRNSENMGANYSRNLGCKIAKGNYFAFLDSDNSWIPNKLELQIDRLAYSNDNVAFVFGRMELNYINTYIIPPDNLNIDELNKIICKENVIDNNTVLIKRSVFHQVGGFDEAMPRLQDWELYYRIIVVYQYAVEYVNEVLDYNVVQADSITRDERKHIDALLLFLEKHIETLNADSITEHMWTLIKKNIKGQDEDRLKKLLAASKIANTSHILYKLLNELYTQTEYYETLLKWKENLERNPARTIFSNYKDMNGVTIAIYGLGKWGELIYDELKGQGIKVLYGIDREKENFRDVVVVRPDEIPTDIEVIIVSVFQQYEEICEVLSGKFDGRIISIKDLITT